MQQSPKVLNVFHTLMLLIFNLKTPDFGSSICIEAKRNAIVLAPNILKESGCIFITKIYGKVLFRKEPIFIMVIDDEFLKLPIYVQEFLLVHEESADVAINMPEKNKSSIISGLKDAHSNPFAKINIRRVGEERYYGDKAALRILGRRDCLSALLWMASDKRFRNEKIPERLELMGIDSSILKED